MAYNAESDRWIPPCDLCGSYRHETIDAKERMELHRCLECGLVAIVHAKGTKLDGGARIPQELLAEAVRRGANGRLEKILVLGEPEEVLLQAASEAGALIRTLSDTLQQNGEKEELVAPSGSLEGARFPLDEFDMILSPHGLERYPSPSLLFERSRLWLRPGGVLLVGAWNFNSLPARLRPKSWMRQHTSGAAHLLGLDTIRRYATRNGFIIGSIRTRSHTRDVAAVVTGGSEPSWFAEMAAAPLALASSMFGMGVLVVVGMSKGSLTTRAILLNTEAESESESASGLAPAMYEELVIPSVISLRSLTPPL
jgi:SAM-dependent methyltransferase